MSKLQTQAPTYSYAPHHVPMTPNQQTYHPSAPTPLNLHEHSYVPLQASTPGFGSPHSFVTSTAPVGGGAVGSLTFHSLLSEASLVIVSHVIGLALTLSKVNDRRVEVSYDQVGLIKSFM